MHLVKKISDWFISQMMLKYYKHLHDFLDQRMAIPDFPSHTVSVERAVKRVTEAGKTRGMVGFCHKWKLVVCCQSLNLNKIWQNWFSMQKPTRRRSPQETSLQINLQDPQVLYNILLHGFLMIC